MKVIITVGISASGKSTWAREEKFRVEHVGQRCVIVNRDTCRHDILNFRQPKGYSAYEIITNIWDVWKFGKDEKLVTEGWEREFEMAVGKKTDVIICSDTNLNLARLSAFITSCHNEYNIMDVEVKEFPITFEAAVKRDNARPDGVGAEVLFKQWLQWNEYKGEYKYIPDTSKPKAIMVDIDGTLARMHNRGAFEWTKVGQDLPRHEIVDMVRGYHMQSYQVVVMSGRDSVCMGETVDWLNHNYIPFDHIFMRAANDMRKDSIVKEELFRTNVADHLWVKAVIDDRVQVVHTWMRMGIPVINVGNPWESF